MRKIRIKFVDVGPGFIPERNLCYRLLKRHYDLELSDTPDYLFCGGLGHAHLRYETLVKIAMIGENVVPDFNCFDYAFGFDHLSFGDRYLRLPLYVRYGEYAALADRTPPQREDLLNRSFCSFVVSNARQADPLRTHFFEELSKYKRVDSGGRYLNNIGGPVADKAAFCRRYKFNIAFENSVSPGYVTEKIMQPLSWFSLPIYYGDPLIESEFNPTSFVRVKDAADVARAIDEIIRLDRNDDEYLARLTAPCLAKPHGAYEAAFEKFLVDIVERPLSAAKRLNSYGYQPSLRQHFRRLEKLASGLRLPLKLAAKLRLA